MCSETCTKEKFSSRKLFQVFDLWFKKKIYLKVSGSESELFSDSDPEPHVVMRLHSMDEYIENAEAKIFGIFLYWVL
jgi:hypothetical protein